MEKWLKWIKAHEKKKAIWAVEQLRKRGYLSAGSFSEDPFKTLDEITALWPERGSSDSDSYKWLELKMRGAWQQHKLRQGLTNRKTYSFTMSQEAKKAINDLARTANKPISRTLEDLILKQGDLLKRLKEKHQKEVAALQQKIHRLEADQPAASPTPAAPQESDSITPKAERPKMTRDELDEPCSGGGTPSRAQPPHPEQTDTHLQDRANALHQEEAGEADVPDAEPTTAHPHTGDTGTIKQITLIRKQAESVRHSFRENRGNLDRE